MGDRFVSADGRFAAVEVAVRRPAPQRVADIEHVSHVFIAGDGIWLIDADGERFLDCRSGTFNLPLGYAHPRLLAAQERQRRKLDHLSGSYGHDLVERLIGRLREVAPPGLAEVHLRSAGGSQAVEGAIKLAQNRTGRGEVVTLWHSHHGQTIATRSMSGNIGGRSMLRATLPGRLAMPDPLCSSCHYRLTHPSCGLRCATAIDDVVLQEGRDRPAAVLIEPILGAGGNVVPPPGYLEHLREWCTRNGVLLIFDEVQTGVGRTGEWFAAQHFGVTPDVVVLAKGLGVAAVISNPETAGRLTPEQHAFTFAGDLGRVALALETLDVIEQEELLDNARRVGAHLVEGLHALREDVDLIGDVRGVGLMIGFDVLDEDGRPSAAAGMRLSTAAFQERLVVPTGHGDRASALKIRPPLITTREQADLILERLVRAARRCARMRLGSRASN
jgi:4-aminobutyrate aminotransferase-like enzyme